MRAVTNVGRVGALAVALGVGVAAATGVVSADPDGSEAGGGQSATAGSSSVSSSSRSSESGETAAGTTPSGSDATDSADGPATGDGDPSDGEDRQAKQTSPESDVDTDPDVADLADTDDPVVDTPQDSDSDAPSDPPTGSEEAPPADTAPPAAQAPAEVPADDGQQPPATGASDVDDSAPTTTARPDDDERKTSPSSGGERRSAAPAAAPEEADRLGAQPAGADDVAAGAEATIEDPGTSTTPLAARSSAAETVAPAVTAVEPDQQSVKPRPSLRSAIKAMGVAVHKLVTGFLGIFGFAPKATGGPHTPSGVAALAALLGWGTRRQTEPSQLPAGGPVAAAAPAGGPVAAAALAVSPAAAAVNPVTSWVAWLTGAKSPNSTGVRFGVAGTDLGIMWDNGVTGDNPATAIVEQHQTLIAFGDTFSGANMTGNWRSNVLFRSADNVLSDGLYVPNGIIHDPGAYSGAPMSVQNFAREIIGKYPYSRSTQVTIIPTGAISVAGAGAGGATRQYIAFMSIKSWDTPGRWQTNYSAISYSDDNGQNWTVVPKSSVRSAGSWRSTVPFRSGNQNFQMVSFVKPPKDSADAAAGYVYAYGTPPGRGGTVYLSRVNDKQILDVSKYQYWDGRQWRTNAPSAARPILPGTTTGAGWFKKTTYPSAGELSVQYNTYLNKYVMLHTDSFNNVVMRTADVPQGTWSSPTRLVSSLQHPGLYAPMIHPWSGTDLLRKQDGSAEDPQYLYWNMSLWGDYNVALMKTDLGAPATTLV